MTGKQKGQKGQNLQHNLFSVHMTIKIKILNLCHFKMSENKKDNLNFITSLQYSNSQTIFGLISPQNLLIVLTF